jgi:putative transposase
MREQGLFARKCRRFNATTDSRHDDPIAPNLVARDFTAASPGRIMVDDSSAVETREGWLYLAVLLELCTRAAACFYSAC